MNTLPKEFEWVTRMKKYEGNPIIRPNACAADMIFNPAAAVKGDEVRLLCRCIDLVDVPAGDKLNWSVSSLVWARSNDGIHFELDKEPFLKPDEASVYKGGFEDPRLVWIPEEEIWVLTYTGVHYFGKTPGLIAYSKDLDHWEFGGEQFPDRAVCIIPKKLNGKYYAYYGNSSLFLSWSEDLRHWHTEKEAIVPPRQGKFDHDLCEGVASPSISENGILLLYNGACPTELDITANSAHRHYQMYSTGVTYSVGWVLLDRNDPRKIIARSDEPFLYPEMPHECYGLTGYTIFASGLVNFRGKHHIYYGCNDMRIGVAIEE